MRRLTEISILKGIMISQSHFEVWTKKIIQDFKTGLDVKKGFDRLESEKAYGGLDYAVFLEGAKIDIQSVIEKEWVECLNSARRGGSIPITPMAAKTLSSIGGMMRLRDCTNSELPWMKKEFESVYPEYQNFTDIEYICPGLEAKLYLPEDVKNKIALTGEIQHD